MALPVPLASGNQVYKYTLDCRLGGGFFGEVWLAHDQTIKKTLAVKFLDPTHATVSKLLREAQVGYRTNHANLATVHYADVVSHKGTNLVAVVMDYYPKGCVLTQVCSGNFVPIRRAIAQISDVLRGLEYLHQQDTLHNDIKPQNILVGANNEGVLTDYGISEVTKAGAPTKPGASYKLHKAPEVITTNEIDPISDIYQVGLTLFRLINGIGLVNDKWSALGESEYQKRVKDGKLIAASDYQPFVPSKVRRIIAKAMDPDPVNRYQSALEMRRAVEKLALTGSWVLDATGEFLGEDAACDYRFTVEPIKGGKFRFTAYRKYRKSGSEKRCGKLCGSGLTARAVEKHKSKFMSAVVEGKL